MDSYNRQRAYRNHKNLMHSVRVHLDPAYENFEHQKVILCKPKRYWLIKPAIGSTLYGMSHEYERKELLESKFIIKDATHAIREKIVDEIKKQYPRIQGADIALVFFFCCGAALE